MASEGWLSRPGRSNYALGPAGTPLITEGTARIYAGLHKEWDGRWLVVAYSVPEGTRELRDRLRSALLFAGLGAVSNGVLISPHDLRYEVQQLITRLGVEGSVTVVRGELASPQDSQALVARAWQLDYIAARYDAFYRRARTAFARDSKHHGNGDLTPARAFKSRFFLTHEYRHFPFIDPDLPAVLLPPDWIGTKAREIFLRYNQLLKRRAETYYLSIAKPSV
jgi:phenylacetic acid degradation operon negative regulatory protein